jgi:hypothetical protein
MPSVVKAAEPAVARLDDDEGISSAQVALMQRGMEILSSRPPVADEAAATRSGSVLVGGSRMQPMEDMREEAAVRGGKRWAARHMMVMTVSSLVLCLLVGSLLLMDVGNQALVPGVNYVCLQ